MEGKDPKTGGGGAVSIGDGHKHEAQRGTTKKNKTSSLLWKGDRGMWKLRG